MVLDLEAIGVVYKGGGLGPGNFLDVLLDGKSSWHFLVVERWLGEMALLLTLHEQHREANQCCLCWNPGP